MILDHARGRLDLASATVMGIVNRTPDSFYDGGRMALEESVSFALDLASQGADVLDLGAVKAGPGRPVPPGEEADRLLPLVTALSERCDLPLSIETADPDIARRAIEGGAAIINDVSGLADPRLAEVCAATGAALVLMHNGGQIRGRPRHPVYEDVVEAVGGELASLSSVAEAAGVGRSAIVWDPGLDFGKNTFHSLELVRRLEELTGPGYPVLVAASRKDVVGETLDLPPDQRLEGSLALAALSVANGARMVRTHDVGATRRVVDMAEAVMGRRAPRAPVRGLWD